MQRTGTNPSQPTSLIPDEDQDLTPPSRPGVLIGALLLGIPSGLDLILTIALSWSSVSITSMATKIGVFFGLAGTAAIGVGFAVFGVGFLLSMVLGIKLYADARRRMKVDKEKSQELIDILSAFAARETAFNTALQKTIDDALLKKYDKDGKKNATWQDNVDLTEKDYVENLCLIDAAMCAIEEIKKINSTITRYDLKHAQLKAMSVGLINGFLEKYPTGSFKNQDAYTPAEFSLLRRVIQEKANDPTASELIKLYDQKISGTQRIQGATPRTYAYDIKQNQEGWQIVSEKPGIINNLKAFGSDVVQFFTNINDRRKAEPEPGKNSATKLFFSKIGNRGLTFFGGVALTISLIGTVLLLSGIGTIPGLAILGMFGAGIAVGFFAMMFEYYLVRKHEERIKKLEDNKELLHRTTDCITDYYAHVGNLNNEIREVEARQSQQRINELQKTLGELTVAKNATEKELQELKLKSQQSNISKNGLFAKSSSPSANSEQVIRQELQAACFTS